MGHPFLKTILPILLFLAGHAPASAQADALRWQAVPHEVLPPDTAYAKGVSALYAALAGQTLWMAGGCNFPHVPAAQGGQKAFYDGIYTLAADSPGGPRLVGRLPEAAAYGVGLPVAGGLLCIGGLSGSGPLARVILLGPDATGLGVEMTELPPLPAATDNMGGALLGRRVYIVGGNAGGRPTCAMYSLHLDSLAAGWRSEPSLPGPPRVQPVAVPLRRDGEMCLYVFGGFAPASNGRPASVSVTSLCYSPSRRSWTAAATPTDEQGNPLTLSGGAAYAADDTTALCLGGVNKDIFLEAIRREGRLAEAVAAGDEAEAGRLREAGRAYLRQPAEAYRFNDRALRYDSAADRWTTLGRHTQAARAGAAMAGAGADFFYIGGELKPGIRTPEIWRGGLKR